MKAGYRTYKAGIDSDDNCIVVDNYPYNNEYCEWPYKINYVNDFADEFTTGVWIPKGTKRPDNWPNKKH